MKKSIVFILLFLLCMASSHAQTAAKSIYAEIGGPGFFLSANYDTRFQKKENGLGGRIGIGFVPNIVASAVTIPVAINYLIGNEMHYLELSAGYTYMNGNSFFWTENENFSVSFEHIGVGYRFQPKRNGLLLRAAIDPLFNKETLQLWGGIGVGYKF